MRFSAILVGGTFGALVVPERWRVPLPPLASPDWDALERHGVEQNARIAGSAAAFLVALTLVWWPIDYLGIQRPPAQQDVFNQWRIATIGIFALMYAVMRYWAVARRNPVMCGAPFAAGGCFAIAYFLGTFGGLEQPYFFMSCAVLIIPILGPASFVQRFAFLTFMSGGLVAGFFLPQPERWDGPLLGEALSFLICVEAGSLLIGQAMYIAFCHRFFQGLLLERTAAEVVALNRDLEERVREKTADLRQLAEHLQVVQEDERGHLARELHDELGQRLSAMRYALALAQQRFAGAPAGIGPNLIQLDQMLDGTLASARAIVAGLRPPVLEQLGLRSAVEWLAQRTSETTGLECRLDLGDDRPCDALVSVATYRVFQESLTNITRHAGATRVEVRLAIEAGGLQLEVVDDGRGFPDEATAPRNRNGLLGMRERASALGGELRTDNLPTGGARVRLRLPMRGPEQPAAPA